MPGVRRIIAGVSGSPRNLPALRYAAELARVYEAAFVPVHAWVPRSPEQADYQFIREELFEHGADAAWQRLRHALDMAFGGLPPGIPAEPLAVHGYAGPVLVRGADQADDVLVIGTGRRSTVSRLWHGTVSRYCLAHARCPVIAIPPPSLDPAAAQGVRGWVLRHQIPSVDDIISGAPHAS